MGFEPWAALLVANMAPNLNLLTAANNVPHDHREGDYFHKDKRTGDCNPHTPLPKLMKHMPWLCWICCKAALVP